LLNLAVRAVEATEGGEAVAAAGVVGATAVEVEVAVAWEGVAMEGVGAEVADLAVV